MIGWFSIGRWFDKCFTLIVNGRGKACVNFEHSWGDGVAVLRYFNDIFNDSIDRPGVHPTTTAAPVDSASAVRELGKCIIGLHARPSYLVLTYFLLLSNSGFIFILIFDHYINNITIIV